MFRAALNMILTVMSMVDNMFAWKPFWPRSPPTDVRAVIMQWVEISSGLLPYM